MNLGSKCMLGIQIAQCREYLQTLKAQCRDSLYTWIHRGRDRGELHEKSKREMRCGHRRIYQGLEALQLRALVTCVGTGFLVSGCEFSTFEGYCKVPLFRIRAGRMLKRFERLRVEWCRFGVEHSRFKRGMVTSMT